MKGYLPAVMIPSPIGAACHVMLRPAKIAEDVTDKRVSLISLKGSHGMLPKNEGVLDRDIRLALGLLLMIPSVFMLTGIVQIIVGVLAVILILTAATGFCPLYMVLGVKTNKAKEIPAAD
jgi:hypothetical protein